MTGLRAPIRIAIIGYGKIARDQHIPAIAATDGCELAAVVSARGEGPDNVPVFTSLEELYRSGLVIDAASHCNTPVARYHTARSTIEHGLATLLEKPPFATLSQCFDIAGLAQQRGTILSTSWHSQHNAAVDQARKWLSDKRIRDVRMNWIEDVRKWHPGQEWIWEPGGFGVFDPGINGLSILTAILPFSVHINEAQLSVPENRAMPIAANLVFGSPDSERIGTATLDWRGSETEQWDIEVECEEGVLCLHDGGKRLTLDGEDIARNGDEEYRGIYRAFVESIRSGESRVNLSPLTLVADAFAIARRESLSAFEA